MPTTPIPPELQELIAKPNPAVIASIKPDGNPHTAPTWYLWEDGRLLVNMDVGRKRLDYLRNDPRVSLTIMDNDSWYQHVTLNGRVVEFVDDPDLKDLDRISQYYRGKPYRVRDQGRISAYIEVESWHAWASQSRK